MGYLPRRRGTAGCPTAPRLGSSAGALIQAQRRTLTTASGPKTRRVLTLLHIRSCLLHPASGPARTIGQCNGVLKASGLMCALLMPAIYLPAWSRPQQWPSGLPASSVNSPPMGTPPWMSGGRTRPLYPHPTSAQHWCSLAAWLSRRITAHVTALTAATQAIAQGYTAQLPVTSSDELGQTSAAFNRMTSTLETQRHLCSRLINDVSHELNTPLSVILLEARHYAMDCKHLRVPPTISSRK